MSLKLLSSIMLQVHIANATAVKSHINDLLSNTRLVGSVNVIELKNALISFTVVALMTISAQAFASSRILMATAAAENRDSYPEIKTERLQLSQDCRVGVAVDELVSK